MGRKAIPKEKVEELAKLSAIGKSCKKISDTVHLHKVTIAKKLKTPEAKRIIESFQQYYLMYAQDIKRGFMELCLSDNPVIREKAIDKYHTIMGITPSHTQSQFIQQIYIDNRQQLLSPIVQGILTEHLAKTITDVEVIEDKQE